MLCSTSLRVEEAPVRNAAWPPAGRSIAAADAAADPRKVRRDKPADGPGTALSPRPAEACLCHIPQTRRSRQLYGVAQGMIRIWIPGADGRELTVALMERGDIFGEIALLDGLPRTANASAI